MNQWGFEVQGTNNQWRVLVKGTEDYCKGFRDAWNRYAQASVLNRIRLLTKEGSL